MKKQDCIFCSLVSDTVLYRSDNFIIIPDKYPVSPGHLLIISKDHKRDFFLLNDAEKKELNVCISIAKNIICRDHDPAGYNIGTNCGPEAGQTIMHFHMHVIPRYEGDMEKPEGGIRHCIPGKGYYE